MPLPTSPTAYAITAGHLTVGVAKWNARSVDTSFAWPIIHQENTTVEMKRNELPMLSVLWHG
ncbi:hypothetical protein ES705_39969 [subsurface metagenome]